MQPRLPAPSCRQTGSTTRSRTAQSSCKLWQQLEHKLGAHTTQPSLAVTVVPQHTARRTVWLDQRQRMAAQPITSADPRLNTHTMYTIAASDPGQDSQLPL